MSDDDDEARELERYANAGAQPNQPRGHALVQPTRALTPIGAQPVAKYRDEAEVRRKLTELAAMAGDDWFYRFPVRTGGGGTDWIEGPSIKLANSVARLFGNCVTEVREVDVGDAWTFYARFTDLETGFSMERAYRQRKSQLSIKSKDRERTLDIAYQIGQSKAIRNVIVNSLQIYADFAFEEAQGSLVTKIGKDLEAWRTRTLEGLARLPVEVHRVERVIGRSQDKWLATDIARIVAMGKAVSDGMATVDETFPPDAEVKPPAQKQTAVSSATPTAQQPGSAEETTAAPSDTDPPARPSPNGQPATSAEPPPARPQTAPKNKDEYLELVRGVCFAAKYGEQLRAWFVSDQQRKIRNGAGLVAADTQEARELVMARIKELEG